jgi:hypothetical protein
MGYKERSLEVPAYKNLDPADRTIVRDKVRKEYSRFRGRVVCDVSIESVADQAEYALPTTQLTAAGKTIADVVDQPCVFWGIADYDWDEVSYDFHNPETYILHYAKLDYYFRNVLHRNYSLIAGDKFRLDPPCPDAGEIIYVLFTLLAAEADIPDWDIPALLKFVEALSLELMIGAQYQTRSGDVSYDLQGVRDRIKELRLEFYGYFSSPVARQG